MHLPHLKGDDGLALVELLLGELAHVLLGLLRSDARLAELRALPEISTIQYSSASGSRTTRCTRRQRIRDPRRQCSSDRTSILDSGFEPGPTAVILNGDGNLFERKSNKFDERRGG